MKISVSHNAKAVRVELKLTGEEIGRASLRALNRTATTARAESARDLHKEYGSLKIGEIKSRIRMERATRNKPVAVLTYSGKRFAVYGRFGMRAVGRWGVRFSKLPWEVETIGGDKVSPERLARAFRQRSSKTGRADVFSRATKARDSLEVLVAPGLARTFAERSIAANLKRVVETRFPEVLRQEANFLLTRRTP